MLSVQDAVNENLIEPIFIGHEVEIQKCAEDIGGIFLNMNLFMNL